jgi:hypothetical protein
MQRFRATEEDAEDRSIWRGFVGAAKYHLRDIDGPGSKSKSKQYNPRKKITAKCNIGMIMTLEQNVVWNRSKCIPKMLVMEQNHNQLIG